MLIEFEVLLLEFSFIRSYFPLSTPIFCAEPRHKRIFVPIGARGAVFRRSASYIGKGVKKRLCVLVPLWQKAQKAKKRHPKG